MTCLQPKDSLHSFPRKGELRAFPVAKSLIPESGSVLNEPDTYKIPDKVVRKELTKLLQHPIFANSARIARFLRFTVEGVLAGEADSLKEYVIGIEVYDRKPPYNPSQDSIVRTEARRLRRKLKEYYDLDGKGDPVFIYFRPGTYVPVFQSEQIHNESQPAQLNCKVRSPFKSVIRVAILPFAAISARPMVSECAQGLTDEVTHAFVRADGFRVAAIGPDVVDASHHVSIPTLMQELDVHVIIDGTVRIEGNLLRVTAQVINADGFQACSQRFEAELNEQGLFQMLESIAAAMVSRVHSLYLDMRQLALSADSGTLDVYREISVAESLLDESTAASFEKALTRLKRITVAAPQYARAYAGIAYGQCAVALSGARNSASAVSRAREAILRAIELEPQMVGVHSCFACVLAFEWKWNEAEARFRHALNMEACTASQRQFALFLCALKRFDEAKCYLEEIEQEDRFLPSQKIAYSRFLYLSRQFDAAEPYWAEASKYGTEPLEAQCYRALCHARLGNVRLASESALAATRGAGLRPALISRIAEVLALCGEKDSATRLIKDWNLLTQDSPVSRVRQALLLLALGEKDAALSMLSAAVSEREAELCWLAVDPGFDPIREEPAFFRILSRVMPEQVRLSQAATA